VIFGLKCVGLAKKNTDGSDGRPGKRNNLTDTNIIAGRIPKEAGPASVLNEKRRGEISTPLNLKPVGSISASGPQ
jgi:hypothetical protein